MLMASPNLKSSYNNMEITGNEIDKEYLFDRDWKNDYFDNKIIYVG